MVDRREYHTWVISKNDSTNRKLYDWAAKQRKMWRDELLLPERKTILLEAGFGIERSGKPQKKSRLPINRRRTGTSSMTNYLPTKRDMVTATSNAMVISIEN
jgi:hypothetical protein